MNLYDNMDQNGCIPLEDEWDHRNTDEIVCPYCGYVHSDSYEAVGDTDVIDECVNCLRKFKWDREVSVTYDSYKIDWLKEWVRYNKRKISERESTIRWFNERFSELELEYAQLEATCTTLLRQLVVVTNTMNVPDHCASCHQDLNSEQLDLIEELHAISLDRADKAVQIEKLVAKYK